MADNNEKSREARQHDGLLSNMEVNISGAQENPFEGKTIFRVPTFVHEAQKDLFKPKMVSIGPYHCNNTSLHSMKKHKWSFIRGFLARNNEVKLHHYISAMRNHALNASNCYSEDINVQGDDFVMMLVLDGLFFLEHLLRLATEQTADSAYCNTGWGYIALTTDMVMLENQIPFSVLHKLYEIHSGGESRMKCIKVTSASSSKLRYSCPLKDLFFNHSVCSSFIYQADNKPQISCDYIQHYLDLIYKCMVSVLRSEEELKDSLKDHGNTGIPCASVLSEAGVKFSRKKSPRDMFDITFINGTMEIPFLSINSDKKIILANIVAFEQTQCMLNHIPPTVMKYLSLMDALVNTKKDVTLLEKNGIFENMLPDEENLAAFFNDLGDFFVPVKYKGHHFSTEIKQYRHKNWPTVRARLMSDYFSNPWAIISVGAAGFLLILSILQTIFTGIQTFKKQG